MGRALSIDSMDIEIYILSMNMIQTLKHLICIGMWPSAAPDAYFVSDHLASIQWLYSTTASPGKNLCVYTICFE